jgi:hypothetical protein
MMRRLIKIVVFAIVALASLAFAATAMASEDRVALVIGNADYQHAPHLATPVDDARDIAAELTGLGFDVVQQQNTGMQDLQRTFADFAEKSAKSEISIVYFAGYSVGNSTDGYVVPVDAELSTPAAYERQAVPIRAALLDVAKAKVLGLVLLDAMRGNPFKARPAALPAPSDAPDGTVSGTRNVLVFFATEPGQTAVEDNGRNSPFAAALLKYLPASDLEISFMFRNIRDEVRKETHQKQTPYMYGQLSREKIFINDVASLRQAELASSRANSSAAQPCDRLAASPEDTSRTRGISGVRLEDINTDKAVPACSDAVRQYPGVDRFHYQLARSLYAARNYPAAVDAYKRAYDLGNTRALYALGQMYDEGIGVDKDPARARFYYEMAVQAKFAPAMVNLAAQYERGDNAAVDFDKALNLYRQAADLGEARAINKLGVFSEKGRGMAANPTQARALYEKAAATGYDEAMINLARCYANGIGGRQDIQGARRLLNKAAQAGSAEAKRILASIDGPKPR